MNGAIVWVSGATGGLGLGIARNVPFEGCRVINISRRPSADFETVVADLSSYEGWETVRQHFRAEMARFTGERAIFIHNAYDMNSVGLLGTCDPHDYERAVVTNCAAPMVLGEAFLSAARGMPFEAGLVLISSGAAVQLIEGLAAYTGAKIGVEHWVQTVHTEFLNQGETNRWVCAFRPGGIDSPGARRNASLPADQWPFVEVRKEMHKTFLDIDAAGQRIWRGLPPSRDNYLLSVGDPPAEAPVNPYAATIGYVA